MTDRLDGLARPDKWYLSAGEGVIWAPPFPRHLDRPGFWDEGHVFHFPVRPLFGVALVDGHGREVPLRRGPTRWRPDRLRVRWRGPSPGPDLLEERAVLPGGRYASVWTLDDDGWRHPVLESAWLVAFTQLPADETTMLPGDALRWTRTITHRGHLSATLGFELVAGSPSHVGVVRSEGRETPSWALTPFPELWREGVGPAAVEQAAVEPGGVRVRGLIHVALAVPLATADPGAPVSFTLGARLGSFDTGRAGTGAADSAGVPAVVPAGAGEGTAGWRGALSSYPRFRCSDPYLERYWDYRIYGLHLNRLMPVPGGYPYPAVAEGIEYFHWPISYSAQCHMLETRWAADPAVARGSLLNFLAAQRDDGSLPGRLHLCPDAPPEPDFYHANWGDAVLAVEALHPDDDFATAAYRGLARYARWLMTARDPERSGMVTVTNHYETGQEYMSRYVAVDPEADRTEWEPRLALKGIDVTVYLHRLQRALAVLAERLGRDDEAARWRDAASVSGGAILERMWDPETGFFGDVDGRTGERTGIKAAVGFYPLLTDLPDDDRVARLLGHLTDPGEFWTRWPVPSSSVDDPLYDPDGLWKGVRHNCPWNGRVWPMTNSHVVDGLLRQWRAGRRDVGPVAAQLLSRFVRMMYDDHDPARPNGFEHYNPNTAHPSRFRGIDDYQHSWVLDLLVRGVAGLDPDGWLDAGRGRKAGQASGAAVDGVTGGVDQPWRLVVDPLPMGLDVELEGARIRGREVDVRIRGDSVTVTVDGVAERRGTVGEPIGIEIENRESRVENRESRIESRASSIESRASSIERRTQRIEGRRAKVEGRGSMSGDRGGVGVSLRGVTKAFGDVVAVHPLDLEVEAGELLVLLGPSGCGKSTVLRMIAGVEEPTGGEVRISGEVVNDREPAERNVAMVFQNYALYPHMKVRDNLAFPLKMRGVRGEALEERVGWAARMLELDGLLDRRPGQLSGGQRQRVALGRALVREPSVFLFDEPLSNLDARLRLEMRDLIASLHQALDATMIFVTHDQVEAMSMGQRIAVLREGRLQQVDPPLETYARPANLFVARFIGSPAINVVDGVLGHDGGGRVFLAEGLTVAGGEGDRSESSRSAMALPGAAGHRDLGGDPERQDRPVVLAIRPEALRLLDPDDPGAHFRRRVRRLEPLGSELLVHVDGPGPAPDPWVARVAPDAPVTGGQEVGVRVDAGRAHLFDAASGTRLGFLGRRTGPG